jgi:fumarate hydratase subunit alpha
MKEISVSEVEQLVYKLAIEANCNLSEDIKCALDKGLEEATGRAKEVLKILIENIELAEQLRVPICQDTGIVMVFLEIGQEVSLTDGNITSAINNGIRRAYHDALLRKSVTLDPIKRKNTEDNTPVIIHTDIVSGNSLKATVMPKGSGSENMSGLWMFKPADEISEIINTIVMHIKHVGALCCPPLIIGIGIGGTFDYAPLLAKKALLRKIGTHHYETHIANIEKQIFDKVNKLNIGPSGMGGYPTALAVNIETYATHIASLPVAVNLSCYANRYQEGII